MADQKISQLTEKQELGGNDLFVIVSGSSNYKVKGSALKTYSQDGLAAVASTGSYNDLSNKPSIPSDTGDLTNNAGFITENDIPELPSNTDLSNYDNTTSKFVNETDLASKQDIIDSTHKLSYGYLSDTPTIPSSIDDLSDVQIDSSTLAGGQLLKYDATSSKWVNGSGNTGTVAFEDITGSATDNTSLATELNGKVAAQTVTTDSSSTSATISSVAGNSRYVYTQPLTALTLTAVVDSNLESEIQFTTDSGGCTFTYPVSLKWIGFNTVSANKSYLVSIKNNIAVLGEIL